MMTRWLVLAAALLASGPAPAQDQAPRPVKLVALVDEQAALRREFFGRVVARQTVDLAFQVSGQILKLPVIEGTRLEQGEMIAQLDLEPFTLDLRQAELEHRQASRQLERQRTLGASTVSQVTIDDAETAADLAGIAVRNAEFALEQATLRAPFDALVANRNVANFTTVSAGTPVVRLHDMSETRIEIEVPEVLFRQAQGDEDLELFAVFPGSEDRYPLGVREFQAETSAIGQTYTVTLGMEPTDDPAIIPGASATVIGRRTVEGRSVFVPPPAVVVDPDRSTHLMVFEPTGADAGTLRKAPVELESHPDGRLELIEGPGPGTEIVAAGAMGLEDGQAVRRFTGFGN